MKELIFLVWEWMSAPTIDHCKKTYPKADFIEQTFSNMKQLWLNGYNNKFKKPLIMCCNITLPILPEEIRSQVVSRC